MKLTIQDVLNEIEQEIKGKESVLHDRDTGDFDRLKYQGKIEALESLRSWIQWSLGQKSKTKTQTKTSS